MLRDDLYDDFCVLPARPEELVARLQHLFWRTGQSMRPDIIEYGPLMLNLETYQAAVSGRVLDLTYMEYELLRFLAGHPAKVFTRETLLSRVWGYEYYGGARTVDVHIRRLRAKLGEEHAHLIQTVRSVGYRFGQVAWHPGVSQRNGVRGARHRHRCTPRRISPPARRPRLRPRSARRAGRAATATAERVGRFSVKYSTQTSLTAANSAMSRRYTVVLTTSANVAPSTASTSATFCSTCRSWPTVPPSTRRGAPVASVAMPT